MKTEIGTDLNQVIELLQSGELVAIPTETVYGLAANGTNEIAIQKIFEAKNRPTSNPLILHFPNEEAIMPYVEEFPEVLRELTEKFWPGPLTILLEKSELVPNLITADHSRVAVRVPSHPLTLELLSNLPFPLAAPSANTYGKISPTKAEHVYSQLNGKIKYILDGGYCNKGLESTIVGVENEKLAIYRLGSISIEQIAEVIGYKPIIHFSSNEAPVTSGMVKHHYAPSTPLYFIDSLEEIDKSDSSGFIFFNRDFIGVANKIILSEMGNLGEAAKNLYHAMHLMDSKKFKQIYIQLFPESNLGRTINDRLRRATAKFRK